MARSTQLESELEGRAGCRGSDTIRDGLKVLEARDPAALCLDDEVRWHARREYRVEIVIVGCAINAQHALVLMFTGAVLCRMRDGNELSGCQ